MMSMDNTRIPRNKIVNVKNIENIYKAFVIDAECFNDYKIPPYDDLAYNVKFIKSDIIKHGEMLEYLKNNHKEFREKLGATQFNDDNIYFKKQILKSHDNLKYLKKKLLN